MPVARQRPASPPAPSQQSVRGFPSLLDPKTFREALRLAEFYVEIGYSLEPSDLEWTAPGKEKPYLAERLRKAGLPEKPSATLLRLAHHLWRANVDHDLYRVEAQQHAKEVERLTKEVVQLKQQLREVVQSPASNGHTIAQPSAATPARTTAPAKVQPKEPSAVPTRKRPRAQGKWHGFSSAKVVCWLGTQGIEFDRARRILAEVGLGAIADSTVRAELSAGRKIANGGNAAPRVPADLSPAQGKELLASSK